MANKKSKSARRLSPAFWIAIAGCGLLLFIGCSATVGTVVYFTRFSGPSVLGKWDSVNPVNKAMRTEYEFLRNGTVLGHSTFTFSPTNVRHSYSFFNYKVIPGDPPVLEAHLFRVAGETTVKDRQDVGTTLRFKMHLERDSMKLDRIDAPESYSVTLTRIR